MNCILKSRRTPFEHRGGADVSWQTGAVIAQADDKVPPPSRSFDALPDRLFRAIMMGLMLVSEARRWFYFALVRVTVLHARSALAYYHYHAGFQL